MSSILFKVGRVIYVGGRTNLYLGADVPDGGKDRRKQAFVLSGYVSWGTERRWSIIEQKTWMNLRKPVMCSSQPTENRELRCFAN